MPDVGENYINISSEVELHALVENINNGSIFADTFRFESGQLFEKFLDELSIPMQEFDKKHYYLSNNGQLVISYSSEGYVLISTMGLVSRKKVSENCFVNAFDMQSVVVTLLINEAFRLLEQEDVYNIDSNNYEQICCLSPTLFHNLLFFFETFAKAYLSLCNRDVPKTHSLELLLQRVKETMIELNHTDTIFHALIVPWLENTVKYIKTVPGEFREHNVKYDANRQDSTVLRFSLLVLDNLRTMLDLSKEFIFTLSCSEISCYLLNKGFFQRLLDSAKTDEEKEEARFKYGFLLDK